MAYEEAFPQLKRCLALMYETLRLYGPVIFIPKYTNAAAQTVVINEKEYTIPPKTYVSLIQWQFTPCHGTGDLTQWCGGPTAGSLPRRIRTGSSQRSSFSLYKEHTCLGLTGLAFAQARNSHR